MNDPQRKESQSKAQKGIATLSKINCIRAHMETLLYCTFVTN